MKKIKTTNYMTYSDQDFDTLLNINTAIYIETYTNHHSHRYEPTKYTDLIELYEHMQNDFNEQSLLIDFGSGLMRVPILFNYLLKIETIGIELNKQLYLNSLKNIKHYQLLHTNNQVSALNINALKYQFTGRETHLFFFNPFSEFVFQKVMENLMNSNVLQCDIILYYALPEYINYLNAINHFNLKLSIALNDIDKDVSERINVYTYTK
ncbi:hypothetical protein [Macrococcoides caseolyticum]|uniref:hypothetical protein n=1 Tax=Macrococcoides caseolyticum TaxID=69966 RepID=UPI001F464DD8|nr:hypothetical protein [Macrococcus caseolyticus]MCE4957107.1 hypothetical protein [Macrococcus caseolyticus]